MHFLSPHVKYIMKITQETLSVLDEDKMSTVAMINNDNNGQTTKHIAIRFNLIREQVQSLVIQLKHLRTKEKTSDILTNSLVKNILTRLRAKLLATLGLKV